MRFSKGPIFRSIYYPGDDSPGFTLREIADSRHGQQCASVGGFASMNSMRELGKESAKLRLGTGD